MDKKKIILTLAAVVASGALASTFIFNYDEDSTTYKVLHSNGFAFATGLLVYYTYSLYT